MNGNYRDRMLGYYPNAIQKIYEFQALVDSEGEEFDLLSLAKDQIVNDAYWLTMGEDRIAQWENKLSIIPSDDSTLDDRREVVIARIIGNGKVNTALIKSIVKTFSGGDCNVWIADSVLYIRLLPSETNKDFILDNLRNEIKIKLPAHLGVDIDRAFRCWWEVDEDDPSWKNVNLYFGTWEDVLYDNRGKINGLDYSQLDDFYLG